jgi:hypothetical protein
LLTSNPGRYLDDFAGCGCVSDPFSFDPRAADLFRRTPGESPQAARALNPPKLILADVGQVLPAVVNEAARRPSAP